MSLYLNLDTYTEMGIDIYRYLGKSKYRCIHIGARSWVAALTVASTVTKCSCRVWCTYLSLASTPPLSSFFRTNL